MQLKKLVLSAGIVLLLTITGALADTGATSRSMPEDAVDKATTGEIKATDLPAEARLTLDRIKRGGPFPYTRDGIPFGNRENLLPKRKRGYYREYTVPTAGAKNRGARRIVASMPSEYYYTDDHYRSFRRIKE